MQQVGELGVFSSCFFRGGSSSPRGIQCRHPSPTLLTVLSVPRPRTTPIALTLRCGLSSAVSPTGAGVQCQLFSKVKKISLGNRMGDQGVDVSADASRRGRTFGASLQGDYDISEPQKVSRTSLRDSTGANVLHRLKQGFVKFKEERFLKEAALFSQLAEGQQPKVMVIACADSRVCPTMLMGLDPGEVFTVRNVANLVPPCEKERVSIHGTSAALEFAVTVLKVEHIIVIGHRNCGGIRALMSRKTTEIESDFIGRWMSCALPAKNHTMVQMEGRSFLDQCRYCEQEAINGSLANLLTFPWIKESFEAGNLGLHGWYYDFVEGELTSWEVQHPSGAVLSFVPLS